MDTHAKLEVIRKIHNLGEYDIAKMFDNNEHLLNKFREHKNPFKFLMYLDSGNAEALFDYVGFKSPNSIDFITKE